MLSWFKKLFESTEVNIEALSDHIEAEFKALVARVEALEGKSTETSAPETATPAETAPAPAPNPAPETPAA